MRILITSGGTSVPIDPVRSITNGSTGRFGSELAVAALDAGMDVIYLAAANSKSPFSMNFDCYKSVEWESNADNLKKLHEFSAKYCAHYQVYRYRDFAEYGDMLKNILEKEQPHIIMLAAAVSDYLVSNYSDNKIRSSENLTIQLESAPKLINFVRRASKKSFLVGFKLLVDAEDSELLAAAMDIVNQYSLDLVVANNLSSIKRGAHEILLVERDGSFQKISQNLATTVIARTLRRSE